MKSIKKSFLLLLSFGLWCSCSFLFGMQNDTSREHQLEQKNFLKLIKLKSFSFVFNNLNLLPHAKETFIEAFMVRALETKDEEETEEKLREEHEKYWKNKCESMSTFLDKGKKVFFHAVKNDKDDVVAFALVFPAIKQTKVYLDLLATHPDYQGNGLGKLLIFSLFERYPQVKKIILHTGVEKNEKAIGFYEHLGFTKDYETEDGICYKLVRK